jgi:polyhydroxyalkanoic acid synthase PhaR subunit
MSEDIKRGSRMNLDCLNMPDLLELWKKIYFSSEEAWAHNAKDFVASKAFMDMLEQFLDQYLSYHQMSNQYLDKYFEGNPVPSKKDIARIAELIIALEDKVDNLDLAMVNNLDSIARSMAKLVDIQEGLNRIINSLKYEVNELRQQLAEQRSVMTAQDLDNPGQAKKSNMEVTLTDDN